MLGHLRGKTFQSKSLPSLNIPSSKFQMKPHPDILKVITFMRAVKDWEPEFLWRLREGSLTISLVKLVVKIFHMSMSSNSTRMFSVLSRLEYDPSVAEEVDETVGESFGYRAMARSLCHSWSGKINWNLPEKNPKETWNGRNLRFGRKMHQKLKSQCYS